MLSFFRSLLARLRAKPEQAPALPPMGHWDPARAVHLPNDGLTAEGSSALQDIRTLWFGSRPLLKPADNDWPQTGHQKK